MGRNFSVHSHPASSSNPGYVREPSETNDVQLVHMLGNCCVHSHPNSSEGLPVVRAPRDRSRSPKRGALQDICDISRSMEIMHLDTPLQDDSVAILGKGMQGLQLEQHIVDATTQNTAPYSELLVRNALTGKVLLRRTFLSEAHMRMHPLRKITESLEAQLSYVNTKASLVTANAEELSTKDVLGDHVFLMDVFDKVVVRSEEPSFPPGEAENPWTHPSASTQAKIIIEMSCVIQHDYQDLEERRALEGLSALDSIQNVVEAIQCPSRDVGQMLALVSDSMRKQLGRQQ